MLIVMAGLPGSGKSALATALGRTLNCAVLAVDPVEAAIWQAGVSHSEPTGLAAYVVVEAMAAEQLRLRHDVIVDAVNGVGPARAQWRQLAAREGAELRFILVECSDPDEHRRRLEQRERGLPGFREPSWQSVLERKAIFPPWTDARLTVDSMNPLPDNLAAALAYLGRDGRAGGAGPVA